MEGDFIVVHLDAEHQPVYAKAFNTEEEAMKHADEASSDVDVWLVRARSGGAKFLRERSEQSSS